MFMFMHTLEKAICDYVYQTGRKIIMEGTAIVSRYIESEGKNDKQKFIWIKEHSEIVELHNKFLGCLWIKLIFKAQLEW